LAAPGPDWPARALALLLQPEEQVPASSAAIRQPQQEARIRALPLARLEALAEALLDFKGSTDLEAWLEAGG
jgi:hypothetical protein